MLLATILATASLAQAPSYGDDDPRSDVGRIMPAQIEAELIDGRRWYTVRARNASVEAVLVRLAALSDRHVEGLQSLERSALVTAELVLRPLDQVLEFVLGSIDLRYELRRDAIIVRSGQVDDGMERLDLASAAWLRAATRYPEHAAAASARLAQGEIAELRGLPSAARDHYLTLAEDYPRSALVGEATMRAGRLTARMGQWGEASRIFRDLANNDYAAEFQSAARLEWARTMIELGDPAAAAHMLSALERDFPPQDDTERSARLLVEARALNARGRHMEALQEMDRSDRDLDAFGAREALRIRAASLEGIGLPGEAARAWLVFAEGAIEHEQATAFEEAARLSLADGDELAVLFVARQAELVGITGLDAYTNEARARLGLDVQDEEPSTDERLRLAEAWLEEGEVGRAAIVLEPIFLARGALGDGMAARVCVDWARCVSLTGGLAPAIDLLAEVRSSFSSLEARKAIDVGAAGLFEAHGRFDDAIEAYRGRYAQP